MQKKTKILFVYGTDFSACEAEEFGINKIVKRLEQGKGLPKTEAFEGTEAEILEFDHVDPKFIDFLYDKILDYDMCKSTNFFVIE